MKPTTPKVYILAYTALADNRSGNPLPREYEASIGISKPWETDGETQGEVLTEMAGRLCYRSWEAGLNPNVTKIREGNGKYLGNVLEQRHGSVLEHTNVTFLFHGVSRVFTHELVRHRVGTAISQESLRYVRLDENSPMVLPPDIVQAIMEDLSGETVNDYVSGLGQILQHITDRFGINEPGVKFSVKKAVTSAMRRFIGMGVATDIVWTANIRTLRHVLEMRSDAPNVEWEMMEVFGRQVGPLMIQMYPALF